VKTVNKITAFEVDKKKLLDQYYTGDQSKADNDTLLVQNGVQKLLKLQKEA